MTCPDVVRVLVPSGPAAVRVSVPAMPTVVRVATPGPTGPQGIPGPAGETAARERRHAWSAPYSYCGVAPVGATTSQAVWRITRLTVSAAGAVTASGVATGATWINRVSATYV